MSFLRLVTNQKSNTFLALRAAGVRIGCEVRALPDFTSRDGLAEWDPLGALVFMYGWPEAALKSVDSLKALGIPVALWQVDDPHYFRRKDLGAVTREIAKRADLYFSHTLELEDEYRELGVRVHYLPTAARELPGAEIAPPLQEDQYERDYALVCTVSPERRAVFERLAALLPARRGALLSGLTQEEVFSVYRRTRINLYFGAYSRGTGEAPDSWGLSERSWEVPLVGGFLLQEERRHLRDHFTLGEDAVSFTDLEDCARKVEHFLRHPDERRAMAARAQERVLSEHKIEHRLTRVIEALRSVVRTVPS